MNKIDQNQLNRTIDGALEALWVKLIEQNQYLTGRELLAAVDSYDFTAWLLFNEWVSARGFDIEGIVGDWE